MSLTVIAHAGLDIARFGETRAALRVRLGKFESFRRTPEASLTDSFPSVGLFLNFDESDRLNLIEATSPAEISYGGVSLLARTYAEVVAELHSQGIDGIEDGSGMQYAEIGFALFSSAPEEDDSVVEGVAVFASGYYG